LKRGKKQIRCSKDDADSAFWESGRESATLSEGSDLMKHDRGTFGLGRSPQLSPLLFQCRGKHPTRPVRLDGALSVAFRSSRADRSVRGVAALDSGLLPLQSSHFFAVARLRISNVDEELIVELRSTA
jgi:hypothetical protein